MVHLSVRQKLVIMMAVMSGMLLAALDQTIVATALPRIVSDLHGLNELSWVVTAYLLTSTITVPISGKLSDIYGRKKLLLLGILVFVAGSALSGLSQNMTQLIAFRALQGVDNASWRWNFYINVPVGIVAFALISKLMPHIETKRTKPIDFLGAGLLAAGLTSMMLGFVWGGHQYAWGSIQVVGMLLASAFILGAFIWVEKRQAVDPIMPLDLFDSSIFRVSMLVVFLLGVAMFGAFLYIPLFAQDVLGRSATNSGVIMTPMILTLVPASIISGQIVSRTGKYKKLAIIGMAMATAGLLALSTLDASSSNRDLIVRMILVGAGLGVGMPIFNLIVPNAFPHSRLGVATSSVQLFRSIGATLGVAVLGSVLNNRLSTHLAGVASDPVNQQLAHQAGRTVDITGLNANQLQTLLSPQAQHAVTAQIARAPGSSHQALLGSYAHFLNSLKDALSSSITEVFLISGLLVSIAFFAVFRLHEIPLRKTIEDQPLVSEGGAPGGQAATH
jgi:MFS family permease